MNRLLVLLLLLAATSLHAQTSANQTATTTGTQAQKPLLVGVKLAPPFVIKEGESYTGLAADLWRDIAQENNWESRYREYDLDGLLDAVASGEVDVAVGAITTTAEREQRMDFSQPLVSSGLGVAVRDELSSGWLAVVQALFSAAFLKIIGLLAVVLFGVGLLVWLLERHHNKEQFGGNHAQGLFSGVWWAMVTMTTVGYGDVAPRTPAGRVLGMAWMLTALIIVSFFTASITSALTVGQLSNRIQNADDLAGMRIASVPGSTSADWLANQKIAFGEAENLGSALADLAAGKLDAVIYDAPLLRWQIAQRYRGDLIVLPMLLERQDYAFAVPEHSALREPLNTSLLNHINGPDWDKRVSRYLDSNN